MASTVRTRASAVSALVLLLILLLLLTVLLLSSRVCLVPDPEGSATHVRYLRS